MNPVQEGRQAMIALELSLIFLGFFAVSYLFTTFLPIVRKNMLIPLTLIFILFFLLYGRTLTPEPIEDRALQLAVQQIERALGFDMNRIVYWLIMFLGWILISGVFLLIFELFMRDRATEISGALESYLSLFGLRNIILIMCFTVPFLVFAGIYSRFMTSVNMFLCILCFTSGQLEVLFSSAKNQDLTVGDKNVIFMVSMSVLNVSLLMISIIVLLLKRI